MLRPSNRLRASADIVRVLKSGRRARFFGFSLYVMPVADTESVTRIACIAGKKAHSSAVVRHALQRRMRAAMSRVLPAIPTACEIVIVADDSVLLTVPFEDMIQTLFYGILELSA